MGLKEQGIGKGHLGKGRESGDRQKKELGTVSPFDFTYHKAGFCLYNVRINCQNTLGLLFYWARILQQN